MKDSDLDIFLDETVECPYCGGEGRYMGSLGSTIHLKCRDCGATFQAHEEE